MDARRRQPVRLWRRRRLARPGLRRCAVAVPADDAPPDDEKRGWSDPDPETWNRRITQGSVPVAQQTMSADADRQPGDNAEADADEAAAPGAAEVPPLGADPKRRRRESGRPAAGRPAAGRQRAAEQAQSPPCPLAASDVAVRLERPAVRPGGGSGERRSVRLPRGRVAVAGQHDHAGSLEMAVSPRPVARLGQPKLRQLPDRRRRAAAGAGLSGIDLAVRDPDWAGQLLVSAPSRPAALVAVHRAGRRAGGHLGAGRLRVHRRWTRVALRAAA